MSSEMSNILRGYDVFGSSPGGLGFTNGYLSYKSMVNELWRKCSGQGVWGNSYAATVVTFLKAFIIGQGAKFSYTGEDTQTKERFNAFINSFLNFNNEPNGQFDYMIGCLIKSGKVVLQLDEKEKRNRKNIRLKVHPYCSDNNYIIRSKNDKELTILSDIDDGFIVKGPNYDKPLNSEQDNLVYGRIGDSAGFNDTPYKPHYVLTDMENIDRASKDMRRLNYTAARVTPTFEVENEQEKNNVLNLIQSTGWKIGSIFAGTAQLKYETPNNTSAIEMMGKEITNAVKNVTAVTGVPVHYLGHADILSNRATAETLFDSIRLSTQSERNVLSDILYDVIMQAQKVYIDSQTGPLLDELIPDFEVDLTVLDFARFESMVKGLSLAKSDGVISKSTYRKHIPGVDPVAEAEQVETERFDDVLGDVQGGSDDNN